MQFRWASIKVTSIEKTQTDYILEPRIQEGQHLKEQHTQFGVISSLFMKLPFQIFKDKIRFLSDVKVRFLRIKREISLEFESN